MFKKILVPLDGSELAESVIPYVEELAKALDSEILLINVFIRGEGLGERMHETYLAHMAEKVRDQLGEAYARRGAEQVSWRVIRGDPAEEIVRCAQEASVSLIALATHGRSGVSRWLLGSLADKVLRGATAPVLLVRAQVAPEVVKKKWVEKDILVPLDGSDLGAAALPLVEQLALQMNAHVTLLQVLEPRQVVTWGETQLIFSDRQRRRLEERALQYLRGVQLGLRERGVVSRTEVEWGLPAEVILERAAEQEVDLIAMSTHGRSGVARWVYGSIAERVLRGAEVPVLLARAQVAEPAQAQKTLVRQCHNCGRIHWVEDPTSEELCIRCGYHLRACGNCVFHDGIMCTLQRAEALEPYPGRNCPMFKAREVQVTLR